MKRLLRGSHKGCSNAAATDPSYPDAEEELSQSALLYESRRPGLGDKLLRHATEVFEEILSQPDRFPKVNRSARVASIIKFHFDVIYRKLTDGDVKVIAVWHHARRPGGWKHRR